MKILNLFTITQLMRKLLVSFQLAVYYGLVILGSLFPSILLAQIQGTAPLTNTKSLSPEEAFQLRVIPKDKSLELEVRIQPGYYLYQSKFNFNTYPAGLLKKPIFSQSLSHVDEFFGRQAIFRHQAHISLPLSSPTNTLQLTITMQGCADLGICYPPLKQEYTIQKGQVLPRSTGSFSTSGPNRKDLVSLLTKSSLSPRSRAQFLPAEQGEAPLPIAFAWKNILKSLLLFFFTGLAMSLTACMYPLIPIVSSIILRRNEYGKSFIATFFYTQGIAITYTLLGLLAAFTGTLLNVYFQQAFFIIPSSLLVVLLGLSMLDVVQLQVPLHWQNLLHNTPITVRNHFLAIFLMGALSALVIGPCTAPPLAFALGYIGTTHNVLLGGSALYVMGLGLGLPLLLFSLLGDRFLPKAGQWMQVIKHLLGVVLLVVAVYLMSPFLPTSLALIAYSCALLFPLTIFYRYPAVTRLGNIIYLGFSMILVILTIYLIAAYFLKVSSELTDFLSLRFKPQQEQTYTRYEDPEVLLMALKANLKAHPNQPVYLDFYAKWCATCKQMEKYTFSDSRVKARLSKVNFFQLDVTRNSSKQRQFMRAFQVYAPPALFVIKSPNRYSQPLLGFKPPKQLLEWIEKNGRF
ncbi:MAG: protein-disulfide reductase DsbD [Neisseriaceae bacterium]